MVQLVYAAEGGYGSPGQPSKFYALVPVLPIVDFMDDEGVDALIEEHFQTGMSRFELGPVPNHTRVQGRPHQVQKDATAEAGAGLTTL